MSQPEADLISWLEQQWNKAAKDSENPDKELLEKYTFYDGLTTAYEFAIAQVGQPHSWKSSNMRTRRKKEIRYNRMIRNFTSPDESPSPDEQGDPNSYSDIIHICEKLLEEDESC